MSPYTHIHAQQKKKRKTGRRQLTNYIHLSRQLWVVSKISSGTPVSHAGREVSIDMTKTVRSQAPVRHPCSLHLSAGSARKPNAFPVQYTFHVFFSVITYGPNSIYKRFHSSVESNRWTILFPPTHINSFFGVYYSFSPRKKSNVFSIMSRNFR